MDKPLFRVIIAGGRYFNQTALLYQYCDKVLSEKRKTHRIEIVSGHCHGADVLGEEYARSRRFGCAIFPAQWSERGNIAGIERNRQMAEYADALIAFWNGTSRGTKNMIETARELGLLVRVKMY